MGLYDGRHYNVLFLYGKHNGKLVYKRKLNDKLNDKLDDKLINKLGAFCASAHRA